MGRASDMLLMILKSLFTNGKANISEFPLQLSLPGKQEGVPFAGIFTTSSEVNRAVNQLRACARISGLSRMIENGDQVVMPYLTFEFKPKGHRASDANDGTQKDSLDVTAILQVTDDGPAQLLLNYSTSKCRELLVAAGYELEPIEECSAFSSPAEHIEGVLEAKHEENCIKAPELVTS